MQNLPVIKFIVIALSISQIDAIRVHPDGSLSSNSGPISFLDPKSWAAIRSKRQGRLSTAYAWTQKDIQLIVDEHNRLRRLVPATDMHLIGWDENLASSAQIHADRCMFAHSTDRRNTGENIYAAPFSNYRNAFRMWFDEVYDRNCGCTNFYKHCCGHYTQVAWASTTKVGCGFAKCDNILYANRHRYILVCQYTPAGNVVSFSTNGQTVGRPGFTYKKEGEKACSRCENGCKCDDGLCSWT